MDYDVFVSHASEDKEVVARPLVGHLISKGYLVWYDEFELKVGDSLRRSIDRGLGAARYGIVILSKSFFAKNWPQYELDALVQKEMGGGGKVILPVWHGVSHQDVAVYSPTLADRVAVVTTLGLPAVCDRLCEVLGRPSAPGKSFTLAPQLRPAREVSKRRGVHRWWRDTCPRCGQAVHILGYQGSDGDEAHWFECAHCGHFEPIG